MAYIPSETEIGHVTKEDMVTINRYQIHMIHIDTDPGDITNTRITIDWSKGYNDTSGKYIAVKRYNVMFRGSMLLAKLSRATTGLSVYGEVQKAAWELLDESGWLPAGNMAQ